MTDDIPIPAPDPELYPSPAEIALKSDLPHIPAFGTAALRDAGTPNGVATLGADGKISPEQMPPVLAGVELVSVSDAAGRFALTPMQVGVGDLVEQTDTRAMYQVLDIALLNKEEGYVQIGIRTAATTAVTLTDGLLAYWKLDEQSGVRADATGNGNDLTDNNGVEFTAGVIGNAAHPDGSNWLAAPANILDNAAEFTIAIWTQKIEGVDKSMPVWQGYGDGGQVGIGLFSMEGIGCPDDGCGINIHAVYKIGDPDTMHGSPNWFFNSLDPTKMLANGAFPLVDGSWYHATLTYDGTTVSLYVNAQLVATNLASGTLDPFDSTMLVGHLFGCSAEILPCPTVDDEAGMWRRCLSAAEVAQLYNNGNGLAYPFA